MAAPLRKPSLAGVGEGLRRRGVRPQRFVYIFAYMFELLLFAAYGHFLPVRQVWWGISAHTFMIAVHGAASLLVMLLWNERFSRLIRASVAVLLAGFLPFLFAPEGNLRAAFGVIAFAGLGGAVTAARCGYTFALTNTERLFGLVPMYFSVVLIKMADRQNAGFFAQKLLPLLFLAGLVLCLLRFRETDLEVKAESDAGDVRGVYWAMAYFIAYFTVDGYSWGLVNSTVRPLYYLHTAGAAFGGVLLFYWLFRRKSSVWYLWNLFFAVSVLMSLFAVLSPQLGTQAPAYLFAGLSVMGWPLALYMLACAHRQFASYRLLKKCTVIFVLASPLASFASDVVYTRFPAAFPAASLAATLGMELVLLMLSPFSLKYLFSSDWLPRLGRSDMARQSAAAPETEPAPEASPAPPADPFAPYALTPRQREVAALLLAARTRRQIAGELGLSESTVKTHTSELYKKLGINSRAELFLRFGVQAKE